MVLMDVHSNPIRAVKLPGSLCASAAAIWRSQTVRMISGRFNGARVLDPVSDLKIERHDGEGWQEVLPGVTGNENPVWAATFGSVETQRLRVVITKAPHNISRLWEIEFYEPVQAGE